MDVRGSTPKAIRLSGSVTPIPSGSPIMALTANGFRSPRALPPRELVARVDAELQNSVKSAQQSPITSHWLSQKQGPPRFLVKEEEEDVFEEPELRDLRSM
jgi:predicted small lipoprotein YifL